MTEKVVGLGRTKKEMKEEKEWTEKLPSVASQKITDVTKWARNPKNSILRTFSNIVFCVFIFLGLFEAHEDGIMQDCGTALSSEIARKCQMPKAEKFHIGPIFISKRYLFV